LGYPAKGYLDADLKNSKIKATRNNQSINPIAYGVIVL